MGGRRRKGQQGRRERMARVGLRLALFFSTGLLLGASGALLARQQRGGAVGLFGDAANERGAGDARGPADAAGPGVAAEAVALLSRADELFSAERYNEALEAYEGAARASPRDPRPPHGMGEVYRKLLLDDKAEEAYRRALAVDPRYLPAKLQLGILLHDLGKSEEAVRLLRELERINPQDPQLWGEIAINLFRLGDARGAASLLERYNAARGPQAWGWARLGQAREEMGDLKGAEEAYRRALSFDPRSPSAHLWLGRLLIATRRESEARKHLETFRKLRDLETQAHNLQMALLRTPDDLNVLVNLARVRHLLGDTEAAFISLRRARELAPKDPRLVEIEAALRGRQGER